MTLNTHTKYPYTKIIELAALCLICLSITLFFNFTSVVKTEVVEDLQDNWRTSYDILVRPQQSAPFMDYAGNRLIEPNFLSGQAGGITMEQYQTILALDGVEVAAPIAVLGNFPTGYWVGNDSVLYQPDSPMVIYKDVMTVTIDDNINSYSAQQVFITVEDRSGAFSMGQNDPGLFIYTDPSGKQYRIGRLMDQDGSTTTQLEIWTQEIATHDGKAMEHSCSRGINLYSLIVGIDPAQEDALVGLKGALTEGRFLNQNDQASYDAGGWIVPALLNENLYRDMQVEIQTYALEIPAGDNFPERLKAEGSTYLEQLPEAELLATRSTSIQDEYSTGFDTDQTDFYIGGLFNSAVLPSPIEYAKIDQVDEYPLTLEAQPKGISLRSPFDAISLTPPETSFRKEILQDVHYQGPDGVYYGVFLDTVGAFNLENLEKNSLSEVPMEMYSLPYAVLRLDEAGQNIEPVQLLPTNNPTSYLSDTPRVFVSLESAHFLAKRDDFISAVRVRVSGVDEIGEVAQEKIEAVAREIETQTGLQVDITLGSSPQNVLIHIPGTGKTPGMGYVEEHWIKQLVGITIQREVNREDLFLFMAILLCSLMYVMANAKLNVIYQQKSIGILSALGWRQGTVMRETAREFYGFAGIGVALSLVTSGIFILVGKSELSLARILIPIPVLLLIYLGGSLLEVRRLLRHTPVEIISTKDLVNGNPHKTTKLTSLANTLRSLLPAGVAVTFSAAAFVFIIGVILQTTGQFKGSLLGEMIVMDVRPYHFILVGLAVLISGLCVFETLLTRTISRKKEIGILKAVGWHKKAIFRRFFYEGLVVNLTSGAVGTGLGILLFRVFYGSLPGGLPILILLGMVMPCLIGGLASLYPAYLASQFDPNEILHSE